MKKGFKDRKNYLLKRFLISYIIILIIPMFIAGLVFRETGLMIKKDALEDNLKSLEQTKYVINQGFKEMDTLSMRITMDESFSWLLNRKGPVENVDTYALRENKQKLGLYNVSTDFIINYYLICPNSNIVLSPKSVYKLSDFYENIYKNETMDYQKWVNSVLNVYHSKTVMPSSPAYVEGDRRSVITYLSSIPFEPALPRQGKIMILINEDEILKPLEGINTNGGGNVFIIDDAGKVVLSKNKTNPIDIPADILKSKSRGFSEREINGDKMLFSYTYSELNGWTLVAVSQSKVVLAKVTYLWNLISFSIVVCLLLGLIAAYLLAYKNAKPIKEIVRMVMSRTENTSSEASNEYNYLESTFSRLIENDVALRDKLQKHLPLAREEFVKRLVKGEMSSLDEIRSNMMQAELSIEGVRFNVIMVHIQGYYGLLSLETLKELNIVKLILKNSFTETRNGSIQAYSIDVDEGAVAFILSYPYEKEEECEAGLTQLVSEVRERMNKEYNVGLSIAAGNFCNNLLDIYYSFSQAKHVFEHDKIWSKEEISWYKGINNEENWFYFYPVDLELRLIKLIKVGSREETGKLLEMIYEENFKKNRISLDMANHLFNELRGTIMKVTEQMSGMESEFFYFINTGMKKLKHCDKIEDACEVITQICLYMCDTAENRKKGRFSKLKEDIILYLNENYMEQQLSLNYVSSKFELSPTNLSHFFKEQIGENFSDYVERLRIEKACDLIQNSNLSVEKIAENTGYSSAYSFRRAFKRCKGVIPSDFKKISTDME